ncbi:MAG: UDP-N-acetylmuramoyl-L-alanine--D-glutamate ligase [Janthinobacterium lividum]
MIQFSLLQDSKVGILGLSRTGIAVYKALKNAVKEIIVWDDNQDNRKIFIEQFDHSLLLPPLDSRWRNLDKFIPSPGIAPTHDLIKTIVAHGVDIISDIDLFFGECQSSKFIAVTGTNGKSTTTALIYHILKSASMNYYMGGNIGVPVLDLPIGAQGYVFELSSFQLELIKDFKPDISILLNITPDHLDRHGTFENYAKIKEKILFNMCSYGSAIINIDNHSTQNIFNNLKKKNFEKRLIPISISKICPEGIAIVENKIYDHIDDIVIFELPFNIYLQGIHNMENIAASYAACRLLGLKAIQILQAIKTFVGLPHRAQYIGTHLGVNFYNDSKATNGAAASKSIMFLDNIFWLAGGIAKKDGIEDLRAYFSKIKKAYLYGKDGHLFAKALGEEVDFEIFTTLKEAFWAANKDATAMNCDDKNILLAPAAASYDQFRSFEHRGETFITLYNELIAET